MPHLDANALSSDLDGIEFLRKVLDVPASATAPRGAFDISRVKLASVSLAGGYEVNRPAPPVLATEMA